MLLPARVPQWQICSFSACCKRRQDNFTKRNVLLKCTYKKSYEPVKRLNTLYTLLIDSVTAAASPIDTSVLWFCLKRRYYSVVVKVLVSEKKLND